MLTHPFLGSLADVSMDELSNKIAELNKKLSFASRNGRYDMANQLNLVLNTYRAELDRKQRELFDATASTIQGKIDIN